MPWAQRLTSYAFATLRTPDGQKRLRPAPGFAATQKLKNSFGRQARKNINNIPELHRTGTGVQRASRERDPPCGHPITRCHFTTTEGPVLLAKGAGIRRLRLSNKGQMEPHRTPAKQVAQQSEARPNPDNAGAKLRGDKSCRGGQEQMSGHRASARDVWLHVRAMIAANAAAHKHVPCSSRVRAVWSTSRTAGA